VSSFQPQAFGRYYLVDKIAVGGMAEVFKAKSYSEAGFEKLLVIKRILDHLSDNSEFVEMFIDEAKLSVELQHANIVQIYDFGRFGDNYYIAMECVEGKDIKGILRKLAQLRKLMPRELALLIAHEMCKGLDHAHKKANHAGEALHIVHRDISPSNIIVSYSGEVKVADFGIAKAESSAFDTKDGVLKGKYEYMSPEQASGQRVDHRSDLFATGIILHEMLTGRRLFKTDSDLKTLEKIKNAPVPPPSELNPSVPPELDRLVLKALSRDPDERFADCRAMQGAILEFLAPQTPDSLRASLQQFMTELFVEEIAGERTKLAEGSRAAEALRAQAEAEARRAPAARAEWEAEQSTGTVQAPVKQSKLPIALAGAALVLAAGLGLALFLSEPETRLVEVERAPVAATTATLQLLIQPPEASPRVFLGDTLISEGVAQVTYAEVTPGAELRLRVEAEGYQPWEDSFTATAGETLRMKPVLQPVPKQTATPVPAPAPAPAPAPVKIDAPAPAPAPVPQVKKAPEEVAYGSLSVNVKSGWGNVYINGKSTDTTPLNNHKLPVGTYTIKVVNPETGLDETRKVTVVAGESKRVVVGN
jgi:tRNA A-37 threonylcarbamoyl transferase component Bud32